MTTFRIKNCLGILTVMIALVLAAGQADAGTIVPNRISLNGLFVSSPAEEDFENLPLGEGTQTNSSVWDEAVLDSNTTITLNSITYGPGLVESDVSFVAGSGGYLKWSGNNWFGLPGATRTIVADETNEIAIDFSGNVTAFGLDLLNYAPNLFGSRDDTVTVTLFGNDDLTILDAFGGIELLANASAVFLGYQDTTGIGKVVITGGPHGVDNWSAILDNVTFGTTAVPVPGAVWLLGSGLVCLVGFRRMVKK